MIKTAYMIPIRDIATWEEKDGEIISIVYWDDILPDWLLDEPDNRMTIEKIKL